jgi:hypothetical protein
MSIKTGFVLIACLIKANSAMGVCNNAIPKTTPDQAFIIHTDGTVTHSATGLMWMRCFLGQTWDGNRCSGTPISYDWAASLQIADSYRYAGYNDWRIPNKNELISIIEEACYRPAINTLIFPTTMIHESTLFVRTSSPVAKDPIRWIVDFDYGDIETDNVEVHNLNGVDITSFYVRLVRGGQ